jgi:hypothetical protein
MLGGPKHSTIEVVSLKAEEGEEVFQFICVKSLNN